MPSLSTDVTQSRSGGIPATSPLEPATLRVVTAGSDACRYVDPRNFSYLLMLRMQSVRGEHASRVLAWASRPSLCCRSEP
ncbi:MAG: hypothetical protein LBK99_18000, partial [Opitutaceae bacterium]|nr:hypothetical protein [Opitutaceae bacterium]